MRIVLLGNGSPISLEAEKRIKKLNVDVFLCHNKKLRIKTYPNKYDIGLSFLYSYLVPSSEINKATWLNFHPAPLPEYGGRNVAYHAIMNNENRFGGTIHYMDETFDTGQIVEVKYFKINESDTAYDIYKRSCDVLLGLFNKYVPLFLSRQEISGTTQSNCKYYKKSKIDDFIQISDELKKEIRAKTYPPFYPKIKIGDKIFKINSENE